MTGFRAALRREWRQLAASRLARAQLLWLPLVGVVVLWAVFQRGVATDLPIVVQDDDRTSASRQLIRMIEAAPGLAVSESVNSMEAGRKAVLGGPAQAIVHVPREFTRRLKRAETAEVNVWYNAQFILTGNVILRELQSAVLTFSAQVEARNRLAHGDSAQAVGINLAPVAARRDSLFNPQLNYVPFLVIGLAFALVQMFAMLAAVRVTGQEFRDGTAGGWLERSGGRIVPAVLAKLVLPTVAYTLIGVACIAGLHGWLGWPMRGSWPFLLGAVLLLVLVYEALGFLVVGVTANYRLASSVAAFVTAPAFAFAGQTFPLGAMPWFAQGWGHALPITAFLRLQIEQVMRGAPAVESLPELAILAGVTVGALALALPLLAMRARDPRSWGQR